LALRSHAAVNNREPDPDRVRVRFV